MQAQIELYQDNYKHKIILFFWEEIIYIPDFFYFMSFVKKERYKNIYIYLNTRK